MLSYNYFQFSTEREPVARSRVDREADNLQLLQLEEKDVISCVATVLSDLRGPGEWMAMTTLHAEVSQKNKAGNYHYI